MKNSGVIWHNGKFVKFKDAKIHVLSHALHYGSGAFEGIRAYRTASGVAIFRLKEHVDRLFYSASVLGIKIPYTKKIIADAIRKTISLNKFNDCYIRPIVFYGEGQMALFPKAAKVNVAVAVWAWGAPLGEHVMLSLGISRYIRFHPKSIFPGAKLTGPYSTSVLTMLESRARGFDDCILLDHEGSVAEGPGENIFIVKKGKLFTPNSSSVLRGITRDSVMAMARDLKIPIAEKKISLKELMDADEVFLTGTAAGVAPVGKISGRKIGGGVGPITHRLQSLYINIVHGRVPRYKKWLLNPH